MPRTPAKNNAPAPAVPANPPRPPKADVLDKSKSYGTVHGDSKAAYWQAGRHYDIHGNRVYMPGEAKTPRTPYPAPAPQANDATPEMASGGSDDDAVSRETVIEAEDVVEGDVNLSAWGAKLENYRFDAIRQAILARYSKQVDNVEDAVAFLHEQGVITDAMLAAWAADDN